MTPTTIIKSATSDGVNIVLTPSGGIKATGDQSAVNNWLPIIREHKAGIVDYLQLAANDENEQAESRAYFAWLIHFTDRNPMTATFSPMVDHAGALACYPDAVAAEPIGAKTTEEPPFITADDADDRHTCTECANLRRDVCTIAKPGGTVSAVIGYRPGAMFKEQLHRCEGFNERGE